MIHNGQEMPGPWRALAVACSGAIILSASRLACGDESDSPEESVASDVSLPAEPSPETLLAQGIELRKQREDRRALAIFERAWLLGAAPAALAQIALAEQALGLWREAHEHLEDALEHAEDSWITTHRATLEVALKEIESRLGAVEISCNVDGAEVKVDGRSVGHTPLPGPVRLAAGNSVVQVLAEGYFDAARQTQIDAGSLARVDFTLTPIMIRQGANQADAPAPTAPPALPARTSAEPIVSSPLRSPMSATGDDAASPREVLMYTAAGLAALGATVGVTGYVIREVNVGLYNDDKRCNLAMGTPRSVECEPELTAWRRGEIVAITGSAAAGVFGLTALYLWWSRPDADEANLACAIGLRSISCGRAF